MLPSQIPKAHPFEQREMLRSQIPKAKRSMAEVLALCKGKETNFKNNCFECRRLYFQDPHSLELLSKLDTEFCIDHWHLRCGDQVGKHPYLRRVSVSTSLGETLREFLDRCEGIPPKYFNQFWDERQLVENAMSHHECLPENLKWIFAD